MTEQRGRINAETPRIRVRLLRVAAALGTAVMAVGMVGFARDPQVQSQAVLAAQGATAERSLSSGEAHAYQVPLAAGAFLHAVVMPRGINVAVILRAPDGRDLMRVPHSGHQVGAETIMRIADIEGEYTIVVKPALDGVPPGRYAVRIEAMRPATETDVARVRAMLQLEAAVRVLRGTVEPKALQETAEAVSAARAGFREVGDRAGEARAVLEIARTADMLGKPEALNAARDAEAHYRALGDELGVAESKQLMADIHLRYGRMAEALGSLTDALAISRRIDDATEAILVLNSLGIVYGRTGESEKAIDSFQSALALARRMQPVPSLEAQMANNLGIATKDLGDYRASRRYYEESLALARRGGNRNSEANTLNNLGTLHRILGDYAAALAVHQEALALARQVGSADHEARALNAIGSIYYHLADYVKAQEHQDQALAIRRRLNDVFALAASLDAAGLTHNRLGDSNRALQELNDALRLRQAGSERHAEATTLRDLALVERDRGDLPAALDTIERAVQLTDSLRGLVVSPDLRASFVASEQERYELYTDVLMQMGFDQRAFEASEQGRARVLIESLLEARTDIRAGIDPTLLGQERGLQRQLDDASRGISRLMLQRAEGQELVSARARLESLNEQYRQLEVRIRQDSPRYAALTSPRPLATSDVQRDLLDANTLLLEYAIGTDRSWLWIVTPAGVESIELPPRREIEPIVRRAYAAITARQSKPDEAPAVRRARVVQADRDWRDASATLSRLVIGPAAARMSTAWRAKRLLIVADEILEYVPFAALPDPAGSEEPLIAGHEVVLLPSASVLALIRQQTVNHPSPNRTVAVLADPVFEADDPRVTRAPRGAATHRADVDRTDSEPDEAALPRALRSLAPAGDAGSSHLGRLPFSRQEAQAILQLVPARQRFGATDFAASRAAVLTGNLGSYRFVHFATHGLLNSNQPSLSGLVFSLVDSQGRAQDGFLRLNDIYNLQLPVDLVVLSACQTAIGPEVRGEGLLGLTRGFMYAGAHRVVASLWQVDDLATAELMREFYRGMLGDRLRPAAALRAAQRELARQPRWASPFFWSGFVLQGEWK